MDVESTSHFFLHCPLKNHSPEHTRKTDCKLTETNKSSWTETLLFGNSLFDLEKISPALNAPISYILSTEIFEEPLL